MKLLKTWLAVVSLLGALASPALAQEVPWFLDGPQHQRLVDALSSRGISVSYGPQYCDGKAGAYISAYKSIQICLQQGTWTPDDLDTLRHEAIHAIQDCRYGSLGDQTLALITSQQEIVKAGETTDLNLELIADIYRNGGLDPYGVLLEWEAWVGAATTSAANLANLIEAVCPVSP